MGVSRAGYYKWKNHKPSPRDNKREDVIAKIKEVQEAYPTHSYRWTAAYVRINMLTNAERETSISMVLKMS